jgi:hypothetical protein
VCDVFLSFCFFFSDSTSELPASQGLLLVQSAFFFLRRKRKENGKCPTYFFLKKWFHVLFKKKWFHVLFFPFCSCRCCANYSAQIASLVRLEKIVFRKEMKNKLFPEGKGFCSGSLSLSLCACVFV